MAVWPDMTNLRSVYEVLARPIRASTRDSEVVDVVVRSQTWNSSLDQTPYQHPSLQPRPTPHTTTSSASGRERCRSVSRETWNKALSLTTTYTQGKANMSSKKSLYTYMIVYSYSLHLTKLTLREVSCPTALFPAFASYQEGV